MLFFIYNNINGFIRDMICWDLLDLVFNILIRVMLLVFISNFLVVNWFV